MLFLFNVLNGVLALLVVAAVVYGISGGIIISVTALVNKYK